MRTISLRRISIILVPAILIITVGIVASEISDMPQTGISLWLLAALLAAGVWFFACAAAFARQTEVINTESDQRDVQEYFDVKTDKPLTDVVAPQKPASDYGRSALVADCRKAVESISSLADGVLPTHAAVALLKNVEDGLSDIEVYENRLRKAIAMCEDVTNEVYIMSVLANVEVGAHADSIAGFEVIAKQIQPLAEAGSMAAIEAKASLDAVFSPIEGIRSELKNVYNELYADGDRIIRFKTCLANAKRTIERLSDEMGCEGK